MNLLLFLGWHFFLLSFIAFGAATSIVPDLHRVLVDSRQLMTDAEFAGLFAMSQAAPGTNIMFVSVFGWHVAGLAGALITTLAFCSPTAGLALTIERLGARHRQSRWYMSLRRAIAPITVGLLMSTGYLLGRNTMTPGGIALMLIAIIVLTRTRMTPLWVTALGGIIGAAGFV